MDEIYQIDIVWQQYGEGYKGKKLELNTEFFFNAILNITSPQGMKLTILKYISKISFQLNYSA